MLENKSLNGAYSGGKKTLAIFYLLFPFLVPRKKKKKTQKANRLAHFLFTLTSYHT